MATFRLVPETFSVTPTRVPPEEYTTEENVVFRIQAQIECRKQTWDEMITAYFSIYNIYNSQGTLIATGRPNSPKSRDELNTRHGWNNPVAAIDTATPDDFIINLGRFPDGVFSGHVTIEGDSVRLP